MSTSLAGKKITIADLRPIDVPPPKASSRTEPLLPVPVKAAKTGKTPPPPPPPLKPPKQDSPPEPSAAERAERKREKWRKKLAKRGHTPSAIDDLAATLAELYPVFDATQRRALQIGIHNTILADLGCDRFLLSTVLRLWCGHPMYLRRMAQDGSHRHALDGSRAGELTVEEKAAALRAWQASQARWRARKVA